MVSRNHDLDVEQLPIIKLSNRDRKIAEHISKLRDITYENIEGGQIHGAQTSFQAHNTGTKGEIAVAKFFEGLNIYDVAALLPFGDNGVDFTFRGATIDVKSTATDLDVPDLIIPERPEPRADWFVLTHVLDEKTVRLIGMAPREEVVDHPVRQQPGTRRNYWVPPQDLILFTD